MTMYKKLAAVAVVAVGAGFLLKPLLNFHVDGPPPEAVQRSDVPVKTSIVKTSVKIPLGFLEKEIATKMKAINPIFESRTDRIKTDIVFGIIGLPPSPEPSCSADAQVIAAKNAVKCFENAKKKKNVFAQGLAHGKCVAEFGLSSLKSASDTISACVEEVVPLPTLAPTLQVNYSVSANRISLTTKDNSLGIKALVSTKLSLPSDLPKQFKQLETSLCGPSVWASADLTPDFSLDNRAVRAKKGHGRIIADLKVGKVTISPGQPCLPSSGKLPEKIVDEINKAILAQISETFQIILRKILRDKANAAVNDDSEPGNVNAQLSDILDKLVAPLDLTAQLEAAAPPLKGTELFLALSPELVTVTGVKTSSKALNIGLGIAAKPTVSIQPPPKENRYVGLRKVDPVFGFHLTPRGEINLDAAELALGKIANTVVKETYPDLRIDHLGVRLYQAKDRLVIGLEVEGATWLGLDGTLFLTGRPVFDAETATVKFEDIKFDAASETFLLSKAAWVLEKPIQKLLSERLEISVEPQFKASLATLSELCLVIDAKAAKTPPILCDAAKSAVKKMALPVAVKVAMNDISLGQIWLSDNALNLTVDMRGDSDVAILD